MSDKPAINETNLEEDYNSARNTLRDLLEKGQTSLDLMIEVARESEHPRAFEVLSGFMKNMADISNQLMELNKRTKEVKQETPGNGQGQLPSPDQQGGVTNNYIFSGSTADLQNFLKKEQDKANEKIIDAEPEQSE